MKCSVVGDEKQTFETERGVRQGCVLGPVLFNLVWHFVLLRAQVDHPDLGVWFDHEEKKDNIRVLPEGQRPPFKVSHCVFADDVVILARTTEALSAFAERLQAAGEDIGIDISVKKTKVLCLANKPEVYEPVSDPAG